MFAGNGVALKNFKLNSSTAGNYEKLLVAFNGAELVYAYFKWSPGAFVGGFYTVEAESGKKVTANPATGVTSCPKGYKEHLLFKQTRKHVECRQPYEALESFICLLSQASIN